MKRNLILLTVTILLICSCHKEKVSTLPVLSSTEISSITDSTAMGGGVISDAGNADIITRGVCWSLTENPTIADSKTSDGIGGGTYTSKLSKLKYATIYYVRAYATNSVGTAYGKDIVFSTNAILPTLTTDSISAITQISAHCGGKIILDGGTITARGICWSTTSTPTIADNKTSDGSGSGNFSSVLLGLTNNTSYYVRAYATNSAGTGYGNEVSFTTLPTSAGTVTDIDGNVYHTVIIGTQIWMVENLKTTHYRNGDIIPNVTDGYTWGNLTSGAFCNFGNEESNYTIYGRLYNGYAASDSRNIAPKGFHVPSQSEWLTLINQLGGVSIAGGKLKESGFTHWLTPNTDASNSSGFTALPGGYRHPNDETDGKMANLGWTACFWTHDLYTISIQHTSGALTYRNTTLKPEGFSIRCIKD